MSNAIAPNKILLAVRPVDLQAVSSVLGVEFDLIICYTLEQAIAHLDDEVALIVCGVRFDQGSMFELLSAARTNPHTKWVPYYLIIGEDIKYSASILEGIYKAAAVRGVTGCIELAKLTSELGKEHTYERVRERLRQLLPASGNRENDRAKFYPAPDVRHTPP
ncbi:hypothetical protein Q8A64_17390 [Oxalobacteraceae bacterium R-40]|uniref:Uncharacterized protein n=1 Tax=Keguizhuia sedimenti TaxID=3064264 RepID=A0ABU1BT35_9BURK|nr:hypothetical protein [Oxalobacteraceae bacterium R-40]